MWAQLVLWLAEWIRAGLAYATFWVEWDSSDVALFAAKLLVLIMLVPLVQFTALLILGIFGMPSMVEHVAARRFQGLAAPARRQLCRQRRSTAASRSLA